MNKTLKALVNGENRTMHFVAIALACLFVAACDSRRGGNADRYVYKNPDKGNEVELKEASTVNRLSEAAKNPPAPTAKKQVRVYDGYFKVNIDTGDVTFRFKKDTPDGDKIKTEEILLGGKLSLKTMKGWIDDTQAKKLNGSRAYAFVSCFPDTKGNVCATSYVSVRYADENGEEQEKQFHASPRDAEIKKRKAAQPTPATQPPIIVVQPSNPSSLPTITTAPTPTPSPATQSLPPSGGAPVAVAPAAPNGSAPPLALEDLGLKENDIVTDIDENEYSIVDVKIEKPAPKLPIKNPGNGKPATAPVKPDEDDDFEEGNSHEDDDDDTGLYVTPQTPETMQGRLIGRKATTNPTPPPPQVTGKNPQSTLGVPLNLAAGGHSRFEPNRGSIINATLMPKSGAGFSRKSIDGKAYGSGFLVSFVQESARRFTMANPQ